VGFGTAGIGIANLLVSVMRDHGLSEDEARKRFYALDVHGLVVEGGEGLRPEQEPFARARTSQTTLPEVIRNAKPTVLIGVSGQAGAFTEEAVREMAKHTERPVIFPLSNPTSRSEATPRQLLEWTGGRALVGTGSPFEPVNLDGKVFRIEQTNNSYIFPGLALGIVSSRATRVSDTMIKAAAIALSGLSPTRTDKQATLLPPLATIRSVSKTVAKAVGEQAIQEGLTDYDGSQFEETLAANIWEPVYKPYEPAP
jgi:malate dehydrogenase (oxaloacetate-decarboxylating)